MKSFQDWLDCQLYSSHLKNLTKIKEETLCMKATSPNRKFLKTANLCKNISYIDLSDHRAQQKPKIHNTKFQLKEMQIIRQNLNFANRLFNVSSVISRDKQVQSYHKYQSLFKKTPINKRFDTLKAKKLQNFMKVSEQNYIKGVHKAIVKIKFHSIPKVPEGKSITFWIELYSGSQKSASNHYNFESIIGEEIIIPLKKKPDRHLMLLFHCSRGLTYINLGQYYLQCPKKGVNQKFDDIVSCHDVRHRISLNLQVEEFLKTTKHSSVHLR